MSGGDVVYSIRTSEKFGRYLVAARDVEEGEEILKVSPLVCGPKIATPPICLGCHSALNVPFYKCSKCSWPLCGEGCEKHENHQVECELFAKNGYKDIVQNNTTKQLSYALILPLRAFMLKFVDKDKYDVLTRMQSHLEEQSSSALYRFLRASCSTAIHKLNLYCSDDELLRLCSIFDTNAFEVRNPEGTIKIRGLYPLASLLAHDCKVNTKHSFHGTSLDVLITATRKIKAGEPITLTYTQTLWSTLSRRAHLKQSKNFDCTCERCSDKTELGTYAGSVYCPDCADKSNKILSDDPLDPEADWSCEHCSCTMSADFLKEMYGSMKYEIGCLNRGDPEEFDAFLERYSDTLPPSNSIMLEVKYALSQMLGHVDGYGITELSDALLKRKIEICEELVKVADVLEPGSSKFRGQLLNELQRAMVESVERKKGSGELTEEDSQVEYKRCLQLLTEAMKILETEPSSGIINGNLEYLQKMSK